MQVVIRVVFRRRGDEAAAFAVELRPPKAAITRCLRHSAPESLLS